MTTVRLNGHIHEHGMRTRNSLSIHVNMIVDIVGSLEGLIQHLSFGNENVSTPMVLQ